MRAHQCDNMLQGLQATREYIKRWVKYFAYHRYAEVFLGTFSFFESLILPVPTDIFLAPMVLARPRAWIRLSGLTTITSVIGGIAAYAIGLWFYDTIGVWLIGEYGLEENFASIQAMFDRNAFWAVFISGITIIPYNVVALGGGLFGINFIAFVLGSLTGRALRYFMESFIMVHAGRRVARMMYRFWNWVVIGGGVVTIVAIVAYLLIA